MGRGRGRVPCCEKVGLKKGPWTPAEDAKLIAYIQTHGHDNWRALPKLAGLLRCGKSCRLRWINYLRPDIKRGNFTKDEEETIFRLHKLMGNKWSKIASCLPGRTDNEIKNVWNTHLKKRLAPKEPTPPPPPPNYKAKDPPSSPSNSKKDSKQPNIGSSQPMEANNSFDMMSQLFMELDQCMLAEGYEYNLLVDECRDSPSCSSLESHITSCQELDDSENKQSSLVQMPAIPIGEEIWSLTYDDSYLPTPDQMGPVVVGDGALNNPTISEGDSRRELESNGWWPYLEREPDLGVTMDAEAVEQLGPWEFDGGVLEEFDPVFSCFQKRHCPPSPTDLVSQVGQQDEISDGLVTEAVRSFNLDQYTYSGINVVGNALAC